MSGVKSLVDEQRERTVKAMETKTARCNQIQPTENGSRRSRSLMTFRLLMFVTLCVGGAQFDKGGREVRFEMRVVATPGRRMQHTQRSGL